MGRGKSLTPREKGRIDAYFEQKLGMREIARRLGRSLCVVQNYLRDCENYGKKKSPGRPKSLSEREIRQITRLASNSVRSVSTIKKELGLNVSESTILREIKKQPFIARAKMKRSPRLNKKPQEKTIGFCKITHGNKLASDEKKFNLDGPDGFRDYWRDLRKEPLYFSKRNFGGGSLMVWGAFSSSATLSLAFPSTRMDSLDYQQLLSSNLMPYLEENSGKDFIFQQDNAAMHVSRSTRTWLNDHGVRIIDWPARSPDLNVMENL